MFRNEPEEIAENVLGRDDLQGAQRMAADGDDSVLVALARDPNRRILHVYVTDIQVHEFGEPQPR